MRLCPVCTCVDTSERDERERDYLAFLLNVLSVPFSDWMSISGANSSASDTLEVIHRRGCIIF